MKRFLLFFIAFILIISAVPMQGWAQVYGRYDNLPAPIISVTDMDMPSIDPGKSRSITLTLQSMGNHAQDLVVSPRFTDPISSNNFSSLISIGDINEGAKKYLDLNIAVAENAEPGNYPIVLDFSYYYNDGENKVPGTGNATIYVRVSGKSTSSKLLVSKISTNPEIILPGEDVQLNILFENAGSVDANNVNIRLEGLNSIEGLYMADGTDTKYYQRVPGNMISALSFDLKAATKIKRGPHELILSFEYGEVVEKQKIYLMVGESNTFSSNLIIENLEYPTGNIGADGDFVIKFDLRNNSDADAENVLIKVESMDPTIVPKSNSMLKLNKIMAGESEGLSFAFSPTEDAITRNYPIHISVEYEDDFNEDKTQTINQYVGMNVVADDDDDEIKEKPKLIIDKYTIAPQSVKPGEDFQIDLSIYNTNSSKTVKNIKIFLEAKPDATTIPGVSNTSILMSVDKSNTLYIDSIPPKGSVEKTITMSVMPDAETKTHTISANFEYEDDDGNELMDTELIGVSVVQESKLEAGGVSHKEKAFVGRSTPVSLEFYNTGKVTLYNVMVKLEGDFRSEDGELFVGNLETGNSELFEAKVIPTEIGQLHGAIVLTYEDFTGQVQEIKKDFSFNVENTLGFLNSKPLWITVGILAATITGILIHRKMRREKEFALDD